MPQIVDSVLGDYAGAAPLAAEWRWELADASLYKPRSLCLQYEESDLDFVRRLLAEEGLFFWFEHAGDAASAPFGKHVLVIADHNGACPANPQRRAFYRRADATESEDTAKSVVVGRRMRQ